MTSGIIFTGIHIYSIIKFANTQGCSAAEKSLFLDRERGEGVKSSNGALLERRVVPGQTGSPCKAEEKDKPQQDRARRAPAAWLVNELL